MAYQVLYRTYRQANFSQVVGQEYIIKTLVNAIRNKKIARWIAYLSHYVISVASVYIFLWLPSGTVASPSTPLLIMVLFSVLYWMVFGLVLLIRNRVRKLMEED